MSEVSKYPSSCTKCNNVNYGNSEYTVGLKVKEAFRQQGKSKRIMIIGQDPTVFNKNTVVNKPLMLDEKTSEIRKWLNNIFND